MRCEEFFFWYGWLNAYVRVYAKVEKSHEIYGIAFFFLVQDLLHGDFVCNSFEFSGAYDFGEILGEFLIFILGIKNEREVVHILWKINRIL